MHGVLKDAWDVIGAVSGLAMKNRAVAQKESCLISYVCD
jgi:hypothetical protein